MLLSLSATLALATAGRHRAALDSAGGELGLYSRRRHRLWLYENCALGGHLKDTAQLVETLTLAQLVETSRLQACYRVNGACPDMPADNSTCSDLADALHSAEVSLVCSKHVNLVT